MRRLRLIILMLVPALWMATDTEWTLASGFEISRDQASSSLLAAAQSARPDPWEDACRLNQSARWLNRRLGHQLRPDKTTFATPACSAVFMAPAPADFPVAVPAPVHLSAASWQFRWRTALEPRAPSIS